MLAIVVLVGVNVYFLFSNNFDLWYAVTGLFMLVGLIWLWVYHSKIREKIDRAKGLLAINKRYLARISGDWTSFGDIGEEFINRDHPYSGDLDIVGQKSLFQYLNTTHTWHGRQIFVKSLLEPQFTDDEIYARQNAIAELSGNIDFANEMEYAFSKIGAHDSAKALVDELSDRKIFIKNHIAKLFLKYMPLATVIAIGAAVLFGVERTFFIVFPLIVIQAIIWIIAMLKTQPYLRGIVSLPYKLRAYSKAIDIITTTKLDSDKLVEAQQTLGISEFSATRAMKDLAKISEKVNVRSNAIVWFVANVILLWDIECAIELERWKSKYADKVSEWFVALGEFESLLSFSVLPNICENTCLPTISDEKAIMAQRMGHPLIHADIRVNNGVNCLNNIFIISGSNMSGKTTFMRTIGINLVLARAGSFVCAENMRFSPLEIMTSMRIADDLSEGISTFYAELCRIKGIIELAKHSRDNMIFLIDEIFRGTNSVDRLSGAKTVISRLESLGATGIITTHDLELCDIADNHVRIENYSFSEEYHNGEIHFDYKLKRGKSITTNAEYLMRMVGIGGNEDNK